MNNDISYKVLENNYLYIKEDIKYIPTIDQMAFYSKYPISLYLKSYGSWYNFLKKMNDINLYQKNYSPLILNFLQLIEKTKMTKSYKMGIFLIIFDKAKPLKQSYSLRELALEFKNIYNYKPFIYDFNGKKFINLKNWNIENYENLILSNPIYYLTENNKNSDFFTFSNDLFILNKNLYYQLKNNNFIIDEIINRIHYRNICYFKQKYNIIYEY